MVVGILRVELHFPAPNSLKTKRSILKKVIDRLHNSFNISVSEVDCHDLWQRSVLGICIVGAQRRYINGVLNKVVNLIESIHDVQMLDYGMEFI